ncbi:radical SAM protein [Solidesulfovibrio sp.]|uniref:radical SAM/SPASM domain-containing protein n=1 Tax=Solidesulfovibrio sp. TaxID=2910990 RepID=UPI0026215517|nr:radical SAM protein [Solidesulfovibrio sp.]
MAPSFASVIIELTNHCNFSCPFCPSDAITRPKGFMDPALMDSLLTQIARGGLAPVVQFGLMGEPFLHKGLFDMAARARELGLFLRVFTNGSRLTEANVERVAASGINELYVSYRGVDASAFAELSRTDVSAYREGVRRLVAATPRFPGRVILKVFKDTVYEKALGTDAMGRRMSAGRVEARMAELLAGLVPPVSFAPDRARANHAVKVTDNVSVRFETVSRWVSQENAGREGFVKGVIGACDGLEGHCGILWNGDVTTCCKDYDGKNVFGNATRQSLVGILDGDAGRRLRRSLKCCLLPTDYCRQCRGGDTWRDALVHQLGTIALFKTPLSRLVLGLGRGGDDAP